MTFKYNFYLNLTIPKKPLKKKRNNFQNILTILTKKNVILSDKFLKIKKKLNKPIKNIGGSMTQSFFTSYSKSSKSLGTRMGKGKGKLSAKN